MWQWLLDALKIQTRSSSALAPPSRKWQWLLNALKIQTPSLPRLRSRCNKWQWLLDALKIQTSSVVARPNTSPSGGNGCWTP